MNNIQRILIHFFFKGPKKYINEPCRETIECIDKQKSVCDIDKCVCPKDNDWNGSQCGNFLNIEVELCLKKNSF